MSESKSEKKRGEKERRFSQKQYDMLKRCSEKRDMTEWAEWRKKNKKEDIRLEGAPLQEFYLEGAWLHEDHPNLFGKVYLEGANFRFAEMEYALLWFARLQTADFYSANLKHANLTLANLEGAEFKHTKLQGTTLPYCTVDGATIFVGCEIDRNTWFYGVGLSVVRIDPRVKELLEYNVRRRKWMNWYKWSDWYEGCPQKKRGTASKALCLLVRAFWEISDYGRSTGRIVGVFFWLAFLFAGIYLNCACWRPPGIVSNLEVQPEIGEAVWHYCLRAPVRAVYFSIVTMTTLGFGDMYANKGSIAGHVILAVQVILGYVLLGALITRFAVLFTAGGPGGGPFDKLRMGGQTRGVWRERKGPRLENDRDWIPAPVRDKFRRNDPSSLRYAAARGQAG